MAIAPALVSSLLALAVATGQEDDGLANRNHEAVSRDLKSIATTHPTVVTLLSVGLTGDGRRIEALRLTGPNAPLNRPAILLVANLEGPYLFSTSVALDHARRLAAGYANDEGIRALLDSTVVYVVPSANPDAAEARFETPLAERTATGRGVDNDRDGRQGEDPPADVDGDGRITFMRVPDPDGTWMPDPTDDRVLVEADRTKGERGVWKLYTEGRDADGDEEIAEDAPDDTRVNRNFPSGWEEHEPHAGAFATAEPEVQALVEFVLEKNHLVLVVTYDAQDNLVEAPKSVSDDARPVKRIPPEGVLESDVALLKELGERYRESTGNAAKGSGEDAGTFQRWAYDHRGLLTLNAVLWELPDEPPPKEEGEESEEEGEASEEPATDADPSQDAKHLSWIDGAGEAWRFAPWKPFQHPDLGTVEIGGFTPYARIEPPAPVRRGIADAHYEFFLTLAELLPRVRIAECEKEKLHDGLWKVRAVLQNDAFLPLQSRSARRTRTVRPARLTLRLPEGATLLSGVKEQTVSDVPGSGGRFEAEWLVRAPDGADIVVTVGTNNAGSARRIAEVKP